MILILFSPEDTPFVKMGAKYFFNLSSELTLWAAPAGCLFFSYWLRIASNADIMLRFK
jgi:hypothetical protein